MPVLQARAHASPRSEPRLEVVVDALARYRRNLSATRSPSRASRGDDDAHRAAPDHLVDAVLAVDDRADRQLLSSAAASSASSRVPGAPLLPGLLAPVSALRTPSRALEESDGGMVKSYPHSTLSPTAAFFSRNSTQHRGTPHSKVAVPSPVPDEDDLLAGLRRQSGPVVRAEDDMERRRALLVRILKPKTIGGSLPASSIAPGHPPQQ